MQNKFLGLVLIITGFLLFSVVAQAASLSVKLQQPKSPTTLNSFNVTFVALDTLNRTVTVKCFKKGPSDSSFSQFGADINLTPGGNTDNCKVTSSVVISEGIYKFYVSAKADSEEVLSSEVSVDYKNNTPGTPENYRKEKISACQYKISFKAASDDGKTSKIEVYRSDKTSFSADGNTRVATVDIGSGEEGSAIVDIPECGKEYYFAIRAFNSAGTGSGTVGDSITKTVIDSTIIITPTPGQGAIPVSDASAGEGEVLGEGEDSVGSGDVLGDDSSESASETEKSSDKKLSTAFSQVNIIVGAVLILFSLIYFRVRRSKKSR